MHYDFLNTAIDVNATVEKVNGVDFNSKSINLRRVVDAAVSVTFTRITGDGSDVEYGFEFSTDGINWDTVESMVIKVPSNASAVSNVVLKTSLHNLGGIFLIRLSRVKNGDAVNNITDVNARISF